MALVKLSDYYPGEESSVCDALDALSEATDIQITDDPDKYFDGSPCAFGMVIKETPENNDFDDYIALDDGCLRPLPDPGPLLYDETTIKPTFLYKEEVKGFSGPGYGTPERDPVEMGSVTIPVFAQDMVVLVYCTIFWNQGSGDYVKFLGKYGDQLMETDYTELYQAESNTLTWRTMSAYQNHISHGAGTEANFRLLVKAGSGTVKVITCALVFKAS